MPFRSIVEGAGDAIVATNAVGEVVFSNRAAKALFGDAVDPAPGRALATLLPGWFDARPVAGSEPKLSSSFGRRGDGTEFPAEVSVSATDDGRFWVATIRDVTEVRKSRRVLHGTEEHYRRIIETTHEGVCIADPDYRYVFVNRRLEQMLGYGPGELIGLTVFDLMDEAGAVEQRKRIEDRREGKPQSGELALRRKDGAFIWVMFESHSMMEDGRFQGVLSMLMDITARRSVEARLAQSEAQLREAQAIAHVGSWDWDLTTNVMTRSEECRRIQGLTRVDEPPGRSTDYDTIHPDDRELVAQSIERAIRDRTPWVCDYRLVRADGVRSVHSRGHVIVDGSGVAVRFVGTVHDVTEKREAEARVVLSDRLASVGTLALGVAHEINNPLAALTANLDMIAEEIRKLEGVATSDQLREIADMARQAREAAERVRSIVGGLRTFSRADEDRTVLLDLRRVLELAIEVAFHESRHSARLVKDYGEAPMVLADEGRLGRVFINLLVNAAQSFDEGPTERNEIRVVTGTLADGRAFVEVRDTGRGIPRELQSRIFDPFFTTKAVGVGAGLGLSICHGIVAALRGELTVESDVARGSTFRVVLPRGQPREREEPPAVHEKVAQAKRARVLIVDDDAGVAKALARVLRAHDVVLATNGREALDLLVAGRIFDVILCDMMMPVMSGMELYAQLAATLPDLARKIVFVTGGTFTPPAKAFLDNVPNERIGKPFDMDPLRAMVERAAQ